MMKEISKKEKVGHESNDPDLLTNLPLGIIHHILALIPIRDAVKTCILSHEWRYTWVTLPQLVFEESCPLHMSKDKFKESMQNFISSVLLRHEGPIYKFQMSVPISPCSQTLDQWMLCLSRNDIRELIINMSYDDSCYSELHSTIYSCKKLSHLELYNCQLDTPPSTFGGFLFLRGLHLYGVYLLSGSPDEIETVFADSPLLEKLEILDSASLELCINAPNLKYMSIRGEYEEIRLHAPLLAEMEVDLISSDFTIDNKAEEDYECNYTRLLGGFTNLEKLRVGLFTMKYLRDGIGSCPHSLVLPHLRVINLDGVRYKHLSHMLVVARLIAGAPNLEKLTLQRCFFDTTRYLVVEQASFMDIRSALKSTFEKLRVVEISRVSGHFIEMELIKYLLENSPVLEVISIGICEDLGREEIQVLRDVLLSLSCASPVAKISTFVSCMDLL